MFINTKRVITSTRVFLALSISLILATAAAASTNDRAFLFGDDVSEGGTVGGTPSTTLDSTHAAFFASNDMTVNGGATYTDATARPGATAGTKALGFDGVNDFAVKLGTAVATPGGLGSPAIGDNGYGGDPNYTGITQRFMQGWVKPTGSTATLRQDIAFDTSQFGIFVAAPAAGVYNWGWAAAGGNGTTARTTTTPVTFNQWHHVMNRSGASGILYVDGIAVDTTGGYTAAPTLGTGASTGNLNITFGSNFCEMLVRLRPPRISLKARSMTSTSPSRAITRQLLPASRALQRVKIGVLSICGLTMISSARPWLAKTRAT